MKPKHLIIISSIILSVAILASILILNFYKTELSPTQTLEECHTLKYNSENKIDIVLFSSKEQAEKYSDYLLTINPFSTNKDSFNFYYIDSYTPECEIYKGIALLCYNKELIKMASSCPNDYIVVIKDESAGIRSSSYMNVMSLNVNHFLSVFAHEFGHAIAVLAEEYTPADIPRGAKNCVSDCRRFSTSDGCFQGCSKEDYYRSIDNGIMRTLSSNTFGKFDEFLILEKIKKKIGAGITGAVTQNPIDCSNEKYYLIDGNYYTSNNQIAISNKSIQQGCVGSNGAGFFEYNLILTDNFIIKTGEFNPELIFTDVQEEGQEEISGQIYESDKSFLLKIPAVEKAKTLEIIKDGEKLTEINLETIGAEFCRIR